MSGAISHVPRAPGNCSYRVEMAVSDASDSALFVAFDAEMNKLINGTSMEDAHNIAFPQCLRDILGRALTFQQKLSREVMKTPAMMFQELYIEILLKLFKETSKAAFVNKCVLELFGSVFQMT
ncbi:hypothetical protein F2Q69_00001848 [Brassica cretica]|uniref:Replication factor A C-terminal domain-containing protein n=1 Tax=Brassica cretica TaxID=69181 RepID=A0A8S9P0T0_BRACR|nr:hypothetical protein F2Q69_00001848 [Brassica cretica]